MDDPKDKTPGPPDPLDDIPEPDIPEPEFDDDAIDDLIAAVMTKAEREADGHVKALQGKVPLLTIKVYPGRDDNRLQVLIEWADMMKVKPEPIRRMLGCCKVASELLNRMGHKLTMQVVAQALGAMEPLPEADKTKAN